MVLPVAAGSGAGTRRQLVVAAAAGIHERAQRSIRTRIHIVWHTVEVEIGPGDFDILEDGCPGIGRNSWGIHDLQIAADRSAVNNAQFGIAELKRRAYRTGGRIAGEINNRILTVTILENGQAHSDRVARVEFECGVVPTKGVKGQESSKCDEFMAICVHNELPAIV